MSGSPATRPGNSVRKEQHEAEPPAGLLGLGRGQVRERTGQPGLPLPALAVKTSPQPARHDGSHAEVSARSQGPGELPVPEHCHSPHSRSTGQSPPEIPEAARPEDPCGLPSGHSSRCGQKLPTSELLLLPVTREGGRPHPRQPTSGASMRRWVSRAVPADCGTQICPPAGPSRPRVWAHLPSPPLPPWPRGPCPGCRGHSVASGAAASFQAQYPQRELRKGGAAAASPQSWGSPVATVGEAQAPALRAQGREDRERTCRHPDRSHQRCGQQQMRCWTQGAAVTGLRVEGGPPAR